MLNRMLSIIYILMNKGTVTAGELAERFEVSMRTIYRDVETLSMAGIPVYAKKGKNGGISLTGDRCAGERRSTGKAGRFFQGRAGKLGCH